jgi:hypothetical protein
LEARPGWRNASDPETVKKMLAFNRWLKENAQNTQPRMALLDTTNMEIADSVQSVAAWLRSHLPPA